MSRMPETRHCSLSQGGFVLLPVILLLTLLATVILLLSHDNASGLSTGAGEAETASALYVAEAGFQHALSKARQANCSNYAGLTKQPFGDHSYSVTVTPSGGSPVTFQSTAALAGGANTTIRRSATAVYSAASMQSVIFQPGSEGEDAEIWDQAPDNNYGDSNETWVSSASNDKTRSLLRFNLGAIPAGAKILEATLFLTRRSGSGSDQPVSAHRILNSWSEDLVSWNLREFATNWDVAGSDFDTNAVATTPVGPVNQRYDWDITPLVQGWVDGSYPNYGVVLAAAIAGMPGERFYTSDESNVDRRPGLSVSYACVCGQICAGGAPGNTLLLVVADPTGLTAQEDAKKTLIESWGYAVNLIATSESQTAFDTAAALVDVVYIPELGTTPMNELGTKADDLAVGVITEESRIAIKLGSFELVPFVSTTSINIVDNTHFITETLPTGNVVLSTAAQYFWKLGGPLAPDLHILGELTSAVPGLAYVDVGETVIDGNPAPGRRVKLPWGAYDFDVALFTDDARTIMQRAIEWGAAPPSAGYYLDEFSSLTCDPAPDYTGSDGSLDWSGFQWQETLDDAAPCSGQIEILVDGGSNRLQLTGDGSGIERRVDLSAFSVAMLSFDYLQVGPFDATRYLSIWASADAGSNWIEVGRIDVEGDGTYKSASFDISAYVDSNAMIRFQTADLTATRKIFIDNVRIDDVPPGGGGSGSGSGSGGSGAVTFEEFTDARLGIDGTSITIPTPAGTAPGDLLIATIVTDAEQKSAIIAPPGWTLIDHGITSKQVSMDVLWKIADGTEPGSYDFSWDKSHQAYAWIMRFTGNDPAGPIHNSQSGGGMSSTPVSPAVTTSIANTMIVRIGGFDEDDISAGDPGLPGHTAITMGASSTGAGAVSGGAGYIMQSATGDSGTSSFALGASEEYRAVTIAIAPAP